MLGLFRKDLVEIWRVAEVQQNTDEEDEAECPAPETHDIAYLTTHDLVRRRFVPINELLRDGSEG